MAVPAFPSPSGRMLVNFDGLSVSTTSFDSGWIDVSAYSYLRIAHTCGLANHKHIIHWSTNGIAPGVTVNGPVTLAGVLGTETHVVQARFGRFILDLAAGNTNAQLQCFFFESLNLGALKNLGTGAKLYSAAEAGVRSVRSSDASITVTENANEIDVTVASSPFPFATSGSNDRYGTISNVFGGNFLMGNIHDYTPISASFCRDSAILAGRECSLTNTTVGAIIASASSSITASFSGQDGQNLIAGSVNSGIAGTFLNGCSSSVILASAGAINTTAGNGRFLSIISADSSNILGGERSAHVGSIGSSINSTGNCNLMLSTDGCTISGSTSHNIVLGRSVTASGGYSFSCNLASGNSLTTTTAGRWTVKAPGAVYYYTNAGGTTGMYMAAGASSWTAVSDVNVKENFVPLDGPSVLAKVDSLPVYSYNYIGNPETQRCFGPTAQDWHSLFPSSKDPLGIEQGDLLGVCLAAIKELSLRQTELSAQVKELQEELEAHTGEKIGTYVLVEPGVDANTGEVI